jgi:hypothetical protein
LKVKKYIHNMWGGEEKQTSPPMCISHLPSLSASLVVIQNQLCYLCPSWLSKQVIVFVRGVDKTKKARKAVTLARKMEIIKDLKEDSNPKTCMATNLLSTRVHSNFIQKEKLKEMTEYSKNPLLCWCWETV